MIDLFLCHSSEQPVARAAAVRDVCKDLVAAGLIRAHGWSTDDLAGDEGWAEAAGSAAVEHELNLVSDAQTMLDLCGRTGLASINRSPLAIGLLTGEFRSDSQLPRDDVRGDEPAWLKWFAAGRPRPEFLSRVEAVREILISDGRTPAQGALACIWARSDRTIPIPGFRTAAQIEENVAALRHRPLASAQVTAIAGLIAFDANRG